MRKVACPTKVTALSSIASVALSCGTPLFSTERGHRLRGSRNILKTLLIAGSARPGRVGLKKRLPSKWSEIGHARAASAILPRKDSADVIVDNRLLRVAPAGMIAGRHYIVHVSVSL